MTNLNLPHAVVLDVAFSGYGIIRSLYRYGIPVIGFSMTDRSPESYTRLCHRKVFYRNMDDLLEKLLALAKDAPERPVLFLTTDIYVEFFIQHKQVLEKAFHINTPDNKTLDLLLDKNKMAAFAVENGILIPRSFQVRKDADIDQLANSARFPVILKPFKRTVEWEAAGLKKAYVLQDEKELRKLYENISPIEGNVIVQEYIRGGDDHIYYCLCYFSRQGECLTAFAGRKVRQWPVGTGSTASTVPVDDPFLRDESIRILKKVGFTGLGSVEFKKDAGDSRYYLMEPTAGRTDQQEYIATAAGSNIPLVAYCHLSGVEIEAREPKALDILYIDEMAELQSGISHIRSRTLTLSDWLRSLKGKRVYRYFNLEDPGVFFIGLPAKVIGWLFTRGKNLFGSSGIKMTS